MSTISENIKTIAANEPRVYAAGANDFGMKKTVKGTSPLVLKNVHPKEHDITVKVNTTPSKNLADVNSFTLYSASNGTATIENNELTCTGDSINVLQIPLGKLASYKDKTVTISMQVTNSTYGNLNVLFGATGFPDLYREFFSDLSNIVYTFTHDFDYGDEETAAILRFGATGGTESNIITIKNIQVEIGDTATEYEPYVPYVKNPTALTVSNGVNTFNFNENGVAKVNSISPETTLTLSEENIEFSAAYFTKDVLGALTYGEGQSSIVQVQTGLFNDAGRLYSQSIATGAGSVAFGSANDVHAGNGLTAGHSNDLWQYNAFAFGGGHTVGDQVKHNRYHAILDMGVGETFEEKITYLKENWDAVKEEYNQKHPEDIIKTSDFANFQHLNKISFGFAAGTSNIVTGRSAIALGGYLDASTEYKVALGSFNEDKGTTTVLEVGYGTGREDRKNAFEVMKDGSAKVAVQGTSDNSVVLKSTLKGYLPIVNSESSEWSHRIYGVNSKGIQTMHPATNGTAANTLARRDARGGCQFADPQYAADAVNKRTLESAIANFLVADNSTSEASYRTYVVRASGKQEVMRATNGKMGTTMVMRDANGCSQFNTPVGDNDAATKAYVDKEIKNVTIPDLTAYATTDYVENNFVASSSAEFQEKLSYYQAEEMFMKKEDAYTKEEVNNNIALSTENVLRGTLHTYSFDLNTLSQGSPTINTHISINDTIISVYTKGMTNKVPPVSAEVVLSENETSYTYTATIINADQMNQKDMYDCYLCITYLSN